MLQTVYDKETNEIIIRGEFFDLDKIYFINERLMGTYGVDKSCLLPSYQEASLILKGLNYEIRHAEHGDRELYSAYNGIRKDWFAPVGTPDELIVKEEDQNDPDEIIAEIEDAVTLDLDMDLDEFYEMDEDDQREALEELWLDDEELEFFFAWLHKEQTWFFKSEDYPSFSETNTYLQFRLPLFEGFLYALILRDMLSQKELFLKKSIQQAKENKNGLGTYELNFCRHRLPEELLLTELLMTGLFECVYTAAGDENYDILYSKMLPIGTFNGCSAQDIKNVLQNTSQTRGHEINDILCFIDKLKKPNY